MKKYRIFFVTVPLQTNFKGLKYAPSPDEKRRTYLEYIAEHFPNEAPHEILAALKSLESAGEHFKQGTIPIVYNQAVLFRLGIPVDYLLKKGIKVVKFMNDSSLRLVFVDTATMYFDNVNHPTSPVVNPYRNESLSSWLIRLSRRPEYKAEIEKQFRLFHEQMFSNISLGNSESDLDTADDEDTVVEDTADDE